MSPLPRWYEHVAPATGRIPCGDEEHRLTWSRGKLKLEDHDLGGERALLVLGGEPCACLRALRMWEDQFGMPPEVFGQMHAWLGADAALAPRELQLHRTLGMLLNWERAWKAGRYLTKHGQLIERELRAIAAPVLKEHLNSARRSFGCRVTRAATVRVVAAGQHLGVSGQMDRISVSAEATLSSDWALDVWARGIAVLGDAFVLGVLEPSAPGSPVAVTAVRWLPGAGGGANPVASEARLERAGDGGWTLAWAGSGRDRRQQGAAAE